jgi:hypothetical protein
MLTNSTPGSNNFFLYYGLVWLSLILILAGFIMAGVGPKDYLLSESGPVEMISAIGYLLCAASLLWLAGNWRGRWAATGLMIMFGLRELDFHSRFTSMNLSKIKFYLSPDVALPEKLIGGAVLALFVYCVFRLFQLEGRAWLADLRRGRACAFGVLFAMFCVVASKSLDGFARKLADLNIQVSSQASSYASTFEEVLELGIPFMIGLAIACYYRHGRTGN